MFTHHKILSNLNNGCTYILIKHFQTELTKVKASQIFKSFLIGLSASSMHSPKYTGNTFSYMYLRKVQMGTDRYY